jgi:hypothetical protein
VRWFDPNRSYHCKRVYTATVLAYEYEKELIINGVRKIPDFTMDDPESGDFIIWEHCGMMSNLNTATIGKTKEVL